jgi:hypothetical protein
MHALSMQKVLAMRSQQCASAWSPDVVVVGRRVRLHENADLHRMDRRPIDLSLSAFNASVVHEY